MKIIRRIMIVYNVLAVIICLAGFMLDYNLLSGACVLINGVGLYYWCKLEA